jgi:ribonuclease P protein component
LIDRIHERAVFGRLGRDADRARSGPLTVLRAGVPGSTRPAVAYAISRKVGSAVVRNRLRRQLRVVCRELAADGALDAAAYLVVVRPEAAGAPMTELRTALSSACGRLPALVVDPVPGSTLVGSSHVASSLIVGGDAESMRDRS